MKIQGQNPYSKVHSRKDSKSRSGTDGQAKSSSSGAATAVNVSSTARNLVTLHAPEEADLSKVERLREAVEQGTFQVDAEKIADAMVREESY